MLFGLTPHQSLLIFSSCVVLSFREVLPGQIIVVNRYDLSMRPVISLLRMG